MANKEEEETTTRYPDPDDIDDTDVTSLGKADCELGGYEWRYLAVDQDYSFLVESRDGSEINNARVKIIVKSTSPYKKTLTGIFSLIRNGRETGEVSKTINNRDLYDELVITNSHNTRRCVLVTFDSTKRIVNYSPEMIDATIDENNYIDSFKVGINGKSNKMFRFYDKDYSSNYNQDDFDSFIAAYDYWYENLEEVWPDLDPDDPNPFPEP